MNSNKYYKKKAEEDSLSYFLESYKVVTGESIEVIEHSERPDFICVRTNGSRVGVELAKVRRGHPNDILFEKIVEKRDHMSICHALEMIQRVATEKETKRNEPDWALPGATILLIELPDISLADLKSRIAPETLPDLYATGFIEVWLADFTGVEAYDNVELFCIKPNEWAGYHTRGCQKPYG